MASISAPLGVHSDLVTLRSLAETVTKFSVIWILQLPVIPFSAVCVIFTPSAHHYLPPYHIVWYHLQMTSSRERILHSHWHHNKGERVLSNHCFIWSDYWLPIVTPGVARQHVFIGTIRPIFLTSGDGHGAIYSPCTIRTNGRVGVLESIPPIHKHIYII